MGTFVKYFNKIFSENYLGDFPKSLAGYLRKEMGAFKEIFSEIFKKFDSRISGKVF